MYKKIKNNRFIYLLILLNFIFSSNLLTHTVNGLTNPSKGSVGLQATIPSDPPKTAATITTPSNGQNVTSLPVKVSGLCSSDLLVKLFKNGVFAGSAQCTNGSYALSIDLFNGKNDLVARVYDALDQTGPDSSTVTVTYVQLGFNTSVPQVILTSDYAKRGADPNTDLVWPIILSGGTAPYAVSVDWGDSTTELMSRSVSGSFDITHKYTKSGLYTVIIKVTDANGQSSFLQLVSVANGALAQENQNSSKTSTVTKSVYVWWPTAIAGVLIVMAFWLGGRYKLETLRRDAEKRVQY